MKTWYRLNPYTYGSKSLIETVSVERETDKFVVVAGRRNAKRGGFESYFQTWAEAHTELVDRRLRAYKNALSTMDRTKAELIEAEAMTEPQP